MYNILIVEDQEYQVELLKKILFELGVEIKIFSASNEEDAEKIANKEFIDMFFIDIFLENSSGIELGKTLREIDRYKSSWIIYVTSDGNSINEAVNKIHCYGYIKKPYFKEDILDLVREIIFEKNENIPEERKFIWVELGAINTKIYEKDIIFIEVSRRKVLVHTYVDTYDIKNETLNNILKKIESSSILRTHKSYAVNSNHIEKIVKISNKVYEVVFKNYDLTAQISYSYKNEVFNNIRSKNHGWIGIHN